MKGRDKRRKAAKKRLEHIMRDGQLKKASVERWANQVIGDGIAPLKQAA